MDSDTSNPPTIHITSFSLVKLYLHPLNGKIHYIPEHEFNFKPSLSKRGEWGVEVTSCRRSEASVQVHMASWGTDTDCHLWALCCNSCSGLGSGPIPPVTVICNHPSLLSISLHCCTALTALHCTGVSHRLIGLVFLPTLEMMETWGPVAYFILSMLFNCLSCCFSFNDSIEISNDSIHIL